MRVAMTLFIISSLVSAQETTQRPAAVFEGCQSCHGMPQVDIPGDDLWIGRVATTACVVPAGPKSSAKRSALMEWLRADTPPRPRIERGARPSAGDEGTVASNITKGSVLLAPAGGVGDATVMVRLVWNGEQGEAAVRSVPAGDWEVRGYRVQRVAKDGTPWQIWGSGRGGKKIAVRAGATTKVTFDQRVHVKARAASRRGKMSVGVSVTGDSRMGVSVVRRGDRVPATYALVCGESVTIGSLAYG